jgi:hypothetical protein
MARAETATQRKQDWTNTLSAWRCLEFLQPPARTYLWADKSTPATVPDSAGWWLNLEVENLKALL